MTYLRSRNSAVLFKHEVTEGVAVTPSASTDAILVDGDVKISPQASIEETNEKTGSLDGLGSIVGGMKVDISFAVNLKGSGTPGTAPEFGDLLKSCGFAEQITATAVPASSEVAAAGSANTLTLSTGAAASAQLYRGMPVLLTDNPAAGAYSFISDYTAGKVAQLADTFNPVLDTSTKYQIPVNVLYKPASINIPSGTFCYYEDGVLYKFVGCRGKVSLSMNSGKRGQLSFNLSGLYDSKTDASVPAVTVDNTRPPVWRGGKMLVNRLPTALQTLSLDFGGSLTNPDNPNSQEGFDAAQIISRKTAGSINPSETLVATRDIMADFRSMNKRILHASYGTVAGNRIGVTIPQALYTGQEPGNRDGISSVDVPFEAVGQDSGAFLCFY